MITEDEPIIRLGLGHGLGLDPELGICFGPKLGLVTCLGPINARALIFDR